MNDPCPHFSYPRFPFHIESRSWNFPYLTILTMMFSLACCFCCLVSQIGHNLGYAHSNEGGTSYADQTGMMGYSYSSDDGPIMCFNPAKSWQTQWYASKSTIVDPSAGNCFEGKIYGIADYSNAASSVVLVKIDDASATDYFVTFNRQTGVNSGTVEAGNQVTVVQAGGEGTSYAESSLLAKLSAGGSWSGIIDGKTMTVNVLSITTSSSPAYATVRVSENGNSCTPDPIVTNAPTRLPTRSPTARPSSAPTTSSPTESPSASFSPTSDSPTLSPTLSEAPTISEYPTEVPTVSPSTHPTTTPTRLPTRQPTNLPTSKPTTLTPTKLPTRVPTIKPTKKVPTRRPTRKPTIKPAATPKNK